MTQNGFLGTIGWIKSNLMVSSQASEKGYSNENFYPGASNIPESEASVSFPFKKIGNIVVDENFVASGFSNSNYIQLGNMPTFNTDFEIQIAFSSTKNYHSGSSTTWDTYLIAPSPTDSYYSPGFSAWVKGKYSNRGIECKMTGSNKGSWGITESSANYTSLSPSVNNKYLLRIKKTFDDNTKKYTLNASLLNSAGSVIATETNSTGSTSQYASLPINLSNYVLGVGDGSARTFFSGGSIYLKECYFKALNTK